MSDHPQSPWKSSRWERLAAWLLKPFSPLIKLILGVSQEEAKKKKAEKAAKKAQKKALKKEARLQKESAKKAKKAALEEKKAATSSPSSSLPPFFGPHPLKEDTEETLEEAFEAEFRPKNGLQNLFKKMILVSMAPVTFLRSSFGRMGSISFLPADLQQKIKKDGFFSGIAHFFWEWRENRKKKAEEKANHPGKKDPLGGGNEPLELLEFRSPTIAIINTPLPPAARYIIWIMAGLIASMVLAMSLLPINKVVVLKGRLVSKRPMMIIQPSDDGMVLDIKAQVGDIVKKGQVIGVMDPRLSQAELDAMERQVKIYRAQIKRLKSEVADRPYVPDSTDPYALAEAKNYLHRQRDFRAQLENLDQEIASRQSALQGAEASAAMYGSKLRVALELLRIRQAEQHHEVGTRLATLQAQDAVMDTERQLIEAQKSANSARADLKAAQAKRESYLQSWKADAYDLLSQVEVKLVTTEAGYIKANLKQDLIKLRAPEDGIVLSQGHISRGAVLTAGMPFMTLVPLKGGVEMEGALSSEDSGYLKTGSRAIIKFMSFPYNVYGGAEGTVSVISANSFLPEEAAGDNMREAVLPPDGKAGLFFRVKVQIDRYTLHGTPKFFHPGPGQVVTAEVDVGKRTMMKYLFGNVKANLSEGMREPS